MSFRDNLAENWHAATTLFNLVARPRAYATQEINRILDEQYDNLVRFWPEDVRFAKDPNKPFTTDYVYPFPENPSAQPVSVRGLKMQSHSSLQLTVLKRKWLTSEFLGAIDDKVENLRRAANFPECTLKLEGFNMLHEIAADNSLAPNERFNTALGVHIFVDGTKLHTPK